MYLFLGGDITIRSSEVIGIFDIEECSVSRITADYLNACQKKSRIVNISEDMPKSFIVAEKKTYISNVSHNTIRKRANDI
ncbi:MAG: DUF370 domain-containing protein [Oscillospiraceae bacterium]|nr:DUF370 domain-containing protein [Oscillospiraceae bacterium]